MLRRKTSYYIATDNYYIVVIIKNIIYEGQYQI